MKQLTNILKYATLALLMSISVAPASAATVFAVNEKNALISFDSTTPGKIIRSVFITGLQPNETIQGLEFGPASSAVTLPGNPSCTRFSFLYNDGHSDKGEFCGSGNDITAANFPGLHVTKLHISCSDPFTGGVSNGKSDLAGHTISEFRIIKADGKTCGQANASASQRLYGLGSSHRLYTIDTATGIATQVNGPAPFGANLILKLQGFDFNPASDNPGSTCTQFSFLYNDGHSDKGEYCASGNDITAANFPGLHVTKLHISCSDPFTGGVSNGKSDLAGHTVVSFRIVKPDGKTCGNQVLANGLRVTTVDDLNFRLDPNTGRIVFKLSSTPPSGPRTACTSFSFRYTDGDMDIGDFCGRGADITPTNSPGLHVAKLHISCSDTFPNGASNGKSNLSGHTVQSYTIRKKDGATCSGSSKQDGKLVYAPGDRNVGKDPKVTAIAYTPNANSTTLYGIDTTQNTLVTLGGPGGNPSPNTGQLFTVGPLGLDVLNLASFDIGRNGIALASFTLPPSGPSRLFTINLTTGKATLIGSTARFVFGLAIAP